MFSEVKKWLNSAVLDRRDQRRILVFLEIHFNVNPLKGLLINYQIYIAYYIYFFKIISKTAFPFQPQSLVFVYFMNLKEN